MEAETQRQLSEKEHQRSAAVFEAAKQKVLCSISEYYRSFQVQFNVLFAVSISWERFEKRNSEIATLFWYI